MEIPMYNKPNSINRGKMGLKIKQNTHHHLKIREINIMRPLISIG